MMGILQREYGITRQQALWEYSYDEIQKLISELPFDRVVIQYPKDTKADLERKWLETIADFDSKVIQKDKQTYDTKVKAIELRAKIKKELDLTKRKLLEDELNRLLGE